LRRLAEGAVSPDASIIVDFHLAGRLALFEELFIGRLLISDFVDQELMDANIQLTHAQTVTLSSVDEWNFFGAVRRRKPGLGDGELGALTVARFHSAFLLTNDRQVKQVAEEFKLSVPGADSVLEYAVEIGQLSGLEAGTILEAMIHQGAWIPDKLVELLKQRALPVSLIGCRANRA
jgi:predicted nucleic acid-binding protein